MRYRRDSDSGLLLPNRRIERPRRGACSMSAPHQALLMGGAATGDPLRSYVVSLCLGEGANTGTTFDDEIAANPDLVRDGTVTTSTVVTPPFGTSSLLMPGTTHDSSLFASIVPDWIGSGGGDSTFFASPWCVDAFIRPTNLSAGLQCIGGDDYFSGSATYNGYILIGTTGVVQLQCRNGSCVSAAGAVVNNVWQHIAVTGDGAGNYHIFNNGVSVATGSGTSYTKQGTGSWYWGEQNGASPGFERNFVGNMKCLRITFGHVRYPGTTTFTPPASLAEYA